jgi:hypothetical protein
MALCTLYYLLVQMHEGQEKLNWQTLKELLLLELWEFSFRQKHVHDLDHEYYHGLVLQMLMQL